MFFSRSYVSDYDNIFKEDYDNIFKEFVYKTIETNDSDIYPTKKDDTYVYEIDLPGVKKEGVEVKIEKGLCTITARRKRKEETYNINKYFYLPKHIDSKKVFANMADGVLKLIIKEKIPESEKPTIVKIE